MVGETCFVFMLLALCVFAAAGTSQWQTRQAVLDRYEGCTHTPVSHPVAGTFDVTHSTPAGMMNNLLEYVVTPRPEQCLLDGDLPTAWDWRNISVVGGAPVSTRIVHCWCRFVWNVFNTVSHSRAGLYGVLSSRINIGTSCVSPPLSPAPLSFSLFLSGN